MWLFVNFCLTFKVVILNSVLNLQMSFKRVVLIPEYSYMKVTLELDQEEEMTAAQFKFLISKQMQELFGEKSVPSVDILLFREATRQAILRFHDSERDKVWSTLTCLNSYKDVPCIFHVHQVSSQLLSLAADSRSYQTS